jgi:hypothetical protein
LGSISSALFLVSSGIYSFLLEKNGGMMVGSIPRGSRESKAQKKCHILSQKRINMPDYNSSARKAVLRQIKWVLHVGNKFF